MHNKYPLGGTLLGRGFSPGTLANPLGMVGSLAGTYLGSQESIGAQTAGGVLKGASLGFAAGPIGAAIGAVGGGIVGLLTARQRKREQEEAQRKMEEERREAMERSDQINTRNVLNVYNVRGSAFPGFYPFGGAPVGGGAYEVERGEVVQGRGVELEDSRRLSSDMHAVEGSKHSGGGTMGVGGDRVFTDRIAVPDELLKQLGL